MTLAKLISLLLVPLLILTGCYSSSAPVSAGVPEPICVLENPQTGDRVRFFKEIPFKVPADYDEQKHLAEWTATQKDAERARIHQTNLAYGRPSAIGRVT